MTPRRVRMPGESSATCPKCGCGNKYGSPRCIRCGQEFEWDPSASASTSAGGKRAEDAGETRDPVPALVDYYEVLQVQPSAEPEVIEKAYKALIFKYHPDRGGDEETAKRITGAYYVVSDPKRRAEYDRQRRSGTGGRTAGQTHDQVGSYVRLEDIPPEVIDAMLAAAWVQGAAATARTVGRVAVAGVAVAGEAALAAAEAALDAAESAAESRRREKQEAQARILHDELEAERRRGLNAAARMDQEAAISAARSWRPELPSGHVESYLRFTNADNPPQGLGQMSDEVLVWVATKHVHGDARYWAFSELIRRHPEAELLVGLERTAFASPRVIARAVEPDRVRSRDFGVLKYRIREARLASAEQLNAWIGQERRRRVRRATLGAVAAIAGVLLGLRFVDWSMLANWSALIPW